jgi:CcmD family protein
MEEKSMATLTTAFACVWIGMAFYVGWLGRNQRQLAAQLKALAKRACEARDRNSEMRKAA